MFVCTAALVQLSAQYLRSSASLHARIWMTKKIRTMADTMYPMTCAM